MSNIKSFVDELEKLCNKHNLKLRADREGNIDICPSTNKVEIGFKTFTWGNTKYVELVIQE